MDHTLIESLLDETRVFPPPHSLDMNWHISSLEEYNRLYQESIHQPETFFGRVASELHWFTPWKRVLEFKPPDAKWFGGGTINLCYNCIDRHVERGAGDDLALLWESESLNEKGEPEVRRFTYYELQQETAKLGNALLSLGVRQGDIVTIYMGMVPELAIALLACARIGAVHSVIFGGFSAQSIADRVIDAQSKVILTCDGLFRRGKVVSLKANVDTAIDTLEANCVEFVVCLNRCGTISTIQHDRDKDWETLIDGSSPNCPCTPLEANSLAFLLYTSGSTGKPKGIEHAIGGYLVHTYLSAKYVFNLRSKERQLFWCTADIGWITGHSYVLYGILANRVPTLMYEGAPNFPGEDRFWSIIARHKVTHLYTAPTAIRSFMKWGDEHPQKHDLSSLQILGTVGEPINPESWIWYQERIGGAKCPIVDTYWQTETGGHMITPLPGVTPTKPGSCTLPFFGVDAAIVDEQGHELPPNSGGLLVIRKPWPGMLRGIYGDRERYITTYWSTVRVDGVPVYTAGDGARRDDDGYFWIMGRVDDVINVSGHRLGTMEIESALVSHDAVVEAAVVGMPHEIKGTGIAAFVTLEPHYGNGSPTLLHELTEHVGKEIGPIAKPDLIRFTQTLPKTRSGKIMRRLLRDIAAGKAEITQDISTLEDLNVVTELMNKSSLS